MSESVSLHSIECITRLIDNVRCLNCNNLKGSRLRYPCGHSACEDCALNVQCMVCLSQHTSSQPLHDEQLTQQVKHASALLETYQDLFKTDIYRKQQLSKKLSIEKDLFPHCIQAPVKYFNKRKSENQFILSENKNKNLYTFGGEKTGPLQNIRMEKANFVQEWLNQDQHHRKRKPFADLNVNSPRVTKVKHNNSLTKQSNAKKRNTQSPLSKYLKNVNKKSTCFIECNTSNDNFEKPTKRASNTQDITEKYEKESEIKNPETIIIEDSQSQVIDKDKLAWMAVLEADITEPGVKLECSEVINYTADIERSHISKDTTSANIINNNLKKINKVPFLKKGLLTHQSSDCNRNSKTTNSETNLADNVSIIVESASFTTTINLSKVDNNTPVFTSTSVQTEISTNIDTVDHKPSNEIYRDKTEFPCTTQSLDIFTDDLNNVKRSESRACDAQKINTSKIIIVSDSSESEEDTGDRTLEVIAEVHRSESDGDRFEDVLTELSRTEVEVRKRPVTRGRTPASTDSSDKENFDPNRAKRPKMKKKEYTLKKSKMYQL